MGTRVIFCFGAPILKARSLGFKKYLGKTEEETPRVGRINPIRKKKTRLNLEN